MVRLQLVFFKLFLLFLISCEGDEYWTGESVSSCYLFIELQEFYSIEANSAKPEKFADNGYLPYGLFERSLGMILSWSSQTS